MDLGLCLCLCFSLYLFGKAVTFIYLYGIGGDEVVVWFSSRSYVCDLGVSSCFGFVKAFKISGFVLGG